MDLLKEAFDEANEKLKKDPESFDGYVVGIVPSQSQAFILKDGKKAPFLKISSFMYKEYYKVLSILYRKGIKEDIIFKEAGALGNADILTFTTKETIAS